MAPRKDGTARDAGAVSLNQGSTNFGHSSARLRRIKKLQFGIINPEELKQYSVTQAITVNGRKIPAGVTRYEVRSLLFPLVVVVAVFLFDLNSSGISDVETRGHLTLGGSRVRWGGEHVMHEGRISDPIIQSVVIRSGMVSCCFRSTVTSELNRVATNMG